MECQNQIVVQLVRKKSIMNVEKERLEQDCNVITHLPHTPWFWNTATTLLLKTWSDNSWDVLVQLLLSAQYSQRWCWRYYEFKMDNKRTWTIRARCDYLSLKNKPSTFCVLVAIVTATLTESQGHCYSHWNNTNTLTHTHIYIHSHTHTHTAETFQACRPFP